MKGWGMQNPSSEHASKRRERANHVNLTANNLGSSRVFSSAFLSSICVAAQLFAVRPVQDALPSKSKKLPHQSPTAARGCAATNMTGDPSDPFRPIAITTGSPYLYLLLLRPQPHACELPALLFIQHLGLWNGRCERQSQKGTCL